MIWGINNKWIEFMLDALTISVFVLVMIILVKAMLFKIFEPKPQPIEDFTFMLTTYLGLPFAFWLLLGIGLVLGLPLHGLNLVSVDSHNKATTHYADKNGEKKK